MRSPMHRISIFIPRPGAPSSVFFDRGAAKDATSCHRQSRQVVSLLERGRFSPLSGDDWEGGPLTKTHNRSV